MMRRAYKVMAFGIDAEFTLLSNFIHTSCNDHEGWEPRILGENGSDALG